MQRYLLSLFPSIVCTSIMLVALIALRWISSMFLVSDFILMVVMIITGIFIYYGSIRILFRNDHDEILKAVSEAIK